MIFCSNESGDLKIILFTPKISEFLRRRIPTQWQTSLLQPSASSSSNGQCSRRNRKYRREVREELTTLEHSKKGEEEKQLSPEKRECNIKKETIPINDPKRILQRWDEIDDLLNKWHPNLDLLAPEAPISIIIMVY